MVLNDWTFTKEAAADLWKELRKATSKFQLALMAIEKNLTRDLPENVDLDVYVIELWAEQYIRKIGMRIVFTGVRDLGEAEAEAQILDYFKSMGVFLGSRQHLKWSGDKVELEYYFQLL